MSIAALLLSPIIIYAAAIGIALGLERLVDTVLMRHTE